MNRSSPIADTRRYSRHAVRDVHVRIRQAPTGVVRDLGVGGALVEVNQNHQPNEIYSLYLESPHGEPIQLLGRVVRCFPETPPGHPHPRWAAAIAFELLSDRARDQILELISRSSDHFEGVEVRAPKAAEERSAGRALHLGRLALNY